MSICHTSGPGSGSSIVGDNSPTPHSNAPMTKYKGSPTLRSRNCSSSFMVDNLWGFDGMLGCGESARLGNRGKGALIGAAENKFVRMLVLNLAGEVELLEVLWFTPFQDTHEKGVVVLPHRAALFALVEDRLLPSVHGALARDGLEEVRPNLV